MGRPLLLLAALLALAQTAVAYAAAPKKAASWADAEIRLVTGRGLMGGDAARFRPDDVITRGDLADLITGVTGREQAPVAERAARMTMEGLNARLVIGLGLKGEATAFTQAVRRAGLTPPSRLGTETVARLLALRKNHPIPQDPLERAPSDPATRAEAAYSAAQVLSFRGSEIARVRELAASFALPQLGAWQRRVLTTAFGLVGNPYVWGGTSERPQIAFGVQVPGGFDCSGFVWRVYKLQQYAGSGMLASTLRGRTTFTMSGEIPKAQRIPLASLQPADLVFFGTKGVRSKPAEIGHMGVYVGNGWMVHSSRNGVALEPLAGWYLTSFAWGRRPLAEAGLVPDA